MWLVVPITILIAIFALARHRTATKEHQNSENFWKLESEANSTRRKDTSDICFITIDFSKLPFDYLPDGADEVTISEIESAKSSVRQLEGAKIADFSGLTNTKLKLLYGAPNFPMLAQADQNYLTLIRALDKWAALLDKCGASDESSRVAGYAVSIGSDIKRTAALASKSFTSSKNF